MKAAIIISTKHRSSNTDLAGENIKEHLLANHAWEESGEYDSHTVYKQGPISLYTVDNESICHEGLERSIETDIFIFATTHTSASGIPSLSVHMVGNFNDAPLGGKEKTLGITHANLLTQLYFNLKRNNTLMFDTIVEATHHGPHIEKPVVFIEIGSSEHEWPNKEAGNIVAKTIMETLTKEIPNKPSAIGIGGPHHCPHFMKAIDDYSLGHVCPKYNLEFLNEDTLIQMIEKTTPRPEIALLDWKGLGSHKERILALLERLHIQYKKTKDFKENSNHEEQ